VVQFCAWSVSGAPNRHTSASNNFFVMQFNLNVDCLIVFLIERDTLESVILSEAKDLLR
jgi:hypothetical protein